VKYGIYGAFAQEREALRFWLLFHTGAREESLFYLFWQSERANAKKVNERCLCVSSIQRQGLSYGLTNFAKVHIGWDGVIPIWWVYGEVMQVLSEITSLMCITDALNPLRSILHALVICYAFYLVCFFLVKRRGGGGDIGDLHKSL
jgi:hypothetical protein